MRPAVARQYGRMNCPRDALSASAPCKNVADELTAPAKPGDTTH